MTENNISEAVAALESRLQSIQTVQHMLLTVLIGSSESLKERIKVAVDDTLKYKDFLKLDHEMISYLNEIQALAAHAETLKSDAFQEGKKTPSALEIIQGGKQE